MRYLFVVLFFALLLLPQAAFAQTNAKKVLALDAELTISGQLKITGDVRRADLKIYIPQENVLSISVKPDKWKYVEDELKNKMVQITIEDPPAIANYEVKVRVSSKAKTLDNLDSSFWFLQNASRETPATAVTNSMREFAFGKETAFQKALRLMIWLHENFPYDYSALQSERKPRSAIETWEVKTAVSGEYSNLLAALLRSHGIPARVVFSYTFKEISDEFEQDVGHGWAEVFIDGKWVPFDTTFFEAGWLDAAHIKFSNLLENNVTESVTVTGAGSIEWIRNRLKVKVFNYTTFAPQLELVTKAEAAGNEVFLVEGKVSGMSGLQNLRLRSCTDETGKPFFKIFEPDRKFFVLNEQSAFWIVQAPKVQLAKIYSCELLLYDELGNYVKQNVRVRGNLPEPKVTSLASPEQAVIGEKFFVSAPAVGKFFSPNFTSAVDSNAWELIMPYAGRFKVYFYSDGSFGEKDIEAVKRNDFSFEKAEIPVNITEKGWFLANVTVRNLLLISMPGLAKVSFQNQSIAKEFVLPPRGSREFAFNLTAYELGKHKLTIVVQNSGISSFATVVEVLPRSAVTNFFEPLLAFFKAVLEFFKTFFR